MIAQLLLPLQKRLLADIPSSFRSCGIQRKFSWEWFVAIVFVSKNSWSKTGSSGSISAAVVAATIVVVVVAASGSW